MHVYIKNGVRETSFGRGAILERLTAEPLRFGRMIPNLQRYHMAPETRMITLEGYLTSTADTPELRRAELELRRRALAADTAPGERFVIGIGRVTADCTDGELTFNREAPFSGDEAERFTLRAVISGGYFHGDTVSAVPELLSDGLTLPMWTKQGGMTVGTVGSTTVIRVNNCGDVPVGFMAEFEPTAPIEGFCIREASTGKFIECPYSFNLGDTVRISTVRERPEFSVVRANGKTLNLTGHAVSGSELFLLPVGETMLTLGDGVGFTGTLCFRESLVTF